MNKKFEAIIWDCDGVLIDSEIITIKTSVDFFKSYGVNITEKDYINRFLGSRIQDKISILEEESGIPLSKMITKEDLENVKKAKFENYKKYLKPIKNIETVLKSINLPMAVASGSAKDKLDFSLDVAKLKPFFNNDNIFSSDLVQNGKPAPDIFLYAADKLNVKPEKCLVVEDGINGIQAAKSANMSVFAFTGGSHVTEELKQKIQELEYLSMSDDMLELLKLIN